jgi:hypothetical protein
LQTSFHSSGVTGSTENREYLTSAMSANRLSAFIATIVAGVFSGLAWWVVVAAKAKGERKRSSPGQLQSEAAESLSLKVH